METWTAVINSIVQTNSGLGFTMNASFTSPDGKTTNTIDFNVSDPNSINTIIQNQINQYNSVASLLSAAPIGAWSAPQQAAPTLPVISPSQEAQTAWQGNYQTLTQMQTAIAQGIMTNTDAAYTSQLQLVQSGWQISYLPLIKVPNGL